MDMKLVGLGTAAVGTVTTGAGIGKKSPPVTSVGAVVTLIGILLLLWKALAPPPPTGEAEIVAFTLSKG